MCWSREILRLGSIVLLKWGRRIVAHFGEVCNHSSVLALGVRGETGIELDAERYLRSPL
jgi:hypothetical protein